MEIVRKVVVGVLFSMVVDVCYDILGINEINI